MKKSISIQNVENGFLVACQHPYSEIYVFSTAIDLAEWVHDYFMSPPPPADAPDAPKVADCDAKEVTQA